MNLEQLTPIMNMARLFLQGESAKNMPDEQYAALIDYYNLILKELTRGSED